MTNKAVTIEVPEGTTVLTRDMTEKYKDCEEIIIPDGIQVIDAQAFKGFSCKKISMPDSVVEIGYDAFHSCDELESIKMSNNLQCIEQAAFAYCRHLNDMAIPKSVQDLAIGQVLPIENPFEQCPARLSVDPDNPFYSSDEYGAVYDKNKTTLLRFPARYEAQSFQIPDSVERVEPCALDSCYNLSITVPSGTRYCNLYRPFGDVANITVATDHPYWSSDENGVLYNKSKTKLIQYPAGNTRESFKIPDSVKIIGAYAFSNSQIKEAKFGEHSQLKEIEAGAFCGCTDYTGEMHLPDGVEIVGDWAFSDTSPSSVYIPDTVTDIGYCSVCDMYVAPNVSDYVYDKIDSINAQLRDECSMEDQAFDEDTPIIE